MMPYFTARTGRRLDFPLLTLSQSRFSLTMASPSSFTLSNWCLILCFSFVSGFQLHFVGLRSKRLKLILLNKYLVFCTTMGFFDFPPLPNSPLPPSALTAKSTPPSLPY